MSTRMQRYRQEDNTEKRVSRTEANSDLYEQYETNSNFKTVTNLADEKIVISKRNENKKREDYHSRVVFDEIMNTKSSRPKQNLADLFKESAEEKSNINEILQEARDQRKKKSFDDESQKIKKLENYKITHEDLENYIKTKEQKAEVKKETDIDELLNTLTELNLQKRILEKTSELELLNDLLPDSMDETVVHSVPSSKNDKNIETYRTLKPQTNTVTMKLDPSFYTKSMDLNEKDLLADYLPKEPSNIKNFLKILTIIVLLIGIIAAVYFYYKVFF